MSETEATQKSWEGAEDPEMQNKSQQQTKTVGRGLTLGFLIALAVVSLAVGIGAGIGAGYGIFHKDSTDTVMSDPMSTEEQWLVVMNADNGTMVVAPEGGTIFQIDALRSKAPAFTNVPDRIATLATRETAIDFINEGLEEDKAINVVVSFKSGNDTYMVPVTLADSSYLTGDSASFAGVIQAEYLQNGFNKTSFPMDDVNMFILSGSSPSSLDFS